MPSSASREPTSIPSAVSIPSARPTEHKAMEPTAFPTPYPSPNPTRFPVTAMPSLSPSRSPSTFPSRSPSSVPSSAPSTASPTKGISDIFECGDRLIDYHGTESLTLTIQIDAIANIHINASINDAAPDKLIITDLACLESLKMLEIFLDE